MMKGPLPNRGLWICSDIIGAGRLGGATAQSLCELTADVHMACFISNKFGSQAPQRLAELAFSAQRYVSSEKPIIDRCSSLVRSA